MPYLAGYVTPQDYGATGGGTTDDTAAVQTALTAVGAAGGGTLYIPPGTYLLSAALSAPAGVSLLGAGPGVSVLSQSSTSANGITYNPTALSGISVSGLSIVGPGSGTGVGLLIEANSGSAAPSSCVVENVAVRSFGSHGIEVVNGVGCSVTGATVASLGGNGVLFSGGSANAVSAVTGGATVVLTGTVAQAATVGASGNVQVGTASGLGDNGAGEIQLANAVTPPTTNPSGGVAVYAQTGTAGAPIKARDPSGNVRGLVRGWVTATADQTSSGTGQTASTFLVGAVEANAVYLVEAWVYWTTASSATVTTSWSTTATGATMLWNDTTSGGDVITTLTGVSPSWPTGSKLVRLFGTLTTSSTAGNLTFTFASSSVSASVTVKAGSYLILERIK